MLTLSDSRSEGLFSARPSLFMKAFRVKKIVDVSSAFVNVG